MDAKLYVALQTLARHLKGATAALEEVMKVAQESKPGTERQP